MAKMPLKDGDAEVLRSVREAQPPHYLFKIKSFSTLVEEEIVLESDNFEVGDYKWSLCLYPSGDEIENGSGHLSLYLLIKDVENFPHGWEIKVFFKLFVYSPIDDNCLTILDVGAKTRCFNALNTRWGFPQFISLETFNDMSNGYLFQDSCVFGAEIYVIKNFSRGGCVSLIKEPENKCFTWKFNYFPNLIVDHLFSDKFTVGEKEWKLELQFPKRNYEPRGEWLSLYLSVANFITSPLKQKLYARYKLRIRNQISEQHYEKEVICWFSPTANSCGCNQFIKLSDLKDSSNGYLVKNTLIVEIEFMVVSVAKKLP